MNSERRTTRSTSTVDETRAVPPMESTGASILSGALSTSVLGGEIINSQRDHIRTTFIINLLIIGKHLDNHIGGSNSDTSHSTLAVSNSITSGDPPHATTSSSDKNVPYSSTSSHQTKNRARWKSSSPPTGEGDPVEEESSNSIYERHMYLKQHGFPLWIPQPNTTLPRSYQRQGVSIGDVGIFTSDGGFDFLFNPFSQSGCKEARQCLKGCDKTTSWGIATYSHLQSKRPEDNVSLLRFGPVGNEGQGRHSSYTTYEWDYASVLEAKSGPEEEELMNLGVNGSVPPRNQCTFIRSLTPGIAVDDWERLEMKVVALLKDQASMRSHKSPFPSVSGAINSLQSTLSPASPDCGHSNQHHFQGRISFLRGHKRGGSSEVTDSMTLAQCPKAKVAVVHDSDWCSVIRDSCKADVRMMIGGIQPKTFHVGFKRHFMSLNRRMVRLTNHGTVYLEEKTRPSQHPSRLPDVSGKLEVEVFPLFEDRQPGPSQLSDSPEISSLDVQVDSPWSKKVVDNGDGDIKPKKCHDSDEDDEGQLGDEDNLEPDTAFLESILRRIQQVKNNPSFEQSCSPPRSLKRPVDDCDENYSSDSSKVNIHVVTPWSDAFSEYISLQIQKLKSNSTYDNKFKMDRDSSWDPFKLDKNDLDNKHRIMLNAIIKIMFQRPKHNMSSFGDFSLPGYIKESTDDGDGVAKPDLFDVSGEADSISLKGKSVRINSKLHNQAPPNDEGYIAKSMAARRKMSKFDVGEGCVADGGVDVEADTPESCLAFNEFQD
ncbi:uncharacterized protein LACBIDRAFT_295784 [Laccaria bicolor S238N-H82]|uniref:Predicted protein n=1 Tax=Laccaria bicolor (strain S238N-H82 / ATCC MYA-4686) TaxID=486041 RepID=B0DYB1_LACBS|nr:uncharacterized protein LACBIDRAFT_295784 [Laccaria bicolor S238N-H82]EDR00406.1 predicted protein [Laccaria bicolor S238N-H82]|eukprot:XP_001888965.1 predicted protein [Laccaria bicolor S238N-H82]